MTKNRTYWAALAITAFAAVMVFSNTLSYGAAWDDQRFVFASGATDGAPGIPAMFSHAMLRDMPAARGAYRPITTSSYALDWSLGRGQASFFHKTNVLLHALVTMLVFALLTRLGTPVIAAFIGGLVFAVHPVHVEAVANIAGRSELLVALFSVAAVVVYLGPLKRGDDATRGDRALGPGRTVGVLSLFGLALLSKEHGVTLPAVLVAVEVLRPHATPPPLRRLLSRWPLWTGMTAMGAAYLLARRAVLGTLTTSDVAPFIVTLPTWQRITTAVANWSEYARLHLFPLDLAVDYGPAVLMPATPAGLRFWTGVAVGASAIGFAAWGYRRNRLLPLGVAWFALVMLPSSNLIVPIAQWMAERFFYLPSVGFSMAVAALWIELSGRIPASRARLVGVVGLLAVFLLAGRSVTRNGSWVDTETVIATLIDEHPEAFRSQWYMGRLLFERGETAAAFVALDSATALQPMAIEMPLERAEWLLRLGRPAEAEAVVGSLPFGRHADREAHLTRALAAQGRRADADATLAAALTVFPSNATLRRLADSLLASADRPEPIR